MPKTTTELFPLYKNIPTSSTKDKKEWLRLCGVKISEKASVASINAAVTETLNEICTWNSGRDINKDTVFKSKGLWGVQTGRIKPEEMTVAELKNWLKIQEVSIISKKSLRKQDYVDMVRNHAGM